ncbi:MAG: sulfurtransferase complex subunit TusB [Candidatus Ranarchaeia archaeon]|jgi:sulfur relay protein TusB/DsrH
MKILFSTIKSPFSADFASLLAQIRIQSKSDEVGLLLMQDAIHAAYPAPNNPLTSDDVTSIKIYVAKEDLKARGVPKGKLHPNTKIVEAIDVVDLVMEEFDKMVSWS